jgi:hypothetical protein
MEKIHDRFSVKSKLNEPIAKEEEIQTDQKTLDDLS